MSQISRPPIGKGNQRTIADQTAYRLMTATGLGTFSAHKNTNQLNIPSGVATLVTFDDAEYNPSNWYDTATSRFTPKQHGFYRMGAQVMMDSGVAQKHVSLTLYKNGAAYVHLDHVQTSATDDPMVQGSVVVKADGNDYFEVYIEHNFGVDTKDIIAPAGEETNFFQGEFIAYQGS